MEELVSVIVPIYKVEEYIDKCIESIVNQTYKNLEIILIDDGSPDLCPHKCDVWAEKDVRIKVIHKKNEGVGVARNLGLAIALGEYIMFVDSDDYISHDAICSMIERLQKDQSDMVIAKHTKVYPGTSQSLQTYPWLTNRLITKEVALESVGAAQAIPVYVWGKLYRKKILEGLWFKSLKCGEDVYIHPHIIEKCNNGISFMDKVVYYYFQRATSTVHERKRLQIKDSIIASLHVSRFLLEHNCLEGASNYYYSAICQSFETKNDKEIKILIKNAFNADERKILKRGRDGNMIKSIIAARFKSFYAFYKRLSGLKR